MVRCGCLHVGQFLRGRYLFVPPTVLDHMDSLFRVGPRQDVLHLPDDIRREVGLPGVRDPDGAALIQSLGDQRAYLAQGTIVIGVGSDQFEPKASSKSSFAGT